MQRRPSSQQVTWLLDLQRMGQLNLESTYQRKSVWNITDRRYFLDTVFKNYPCPPIFMYEEIDDDGKLTYNIVDGKQRLETIFMFYDNEIALSKKYGDIKYDGKKFDELDIEQKKQFWDYILLVDFVDSDNIDIIKEVFNRLNRNTKNLNDQELRHARYDGWFISEVEKEAERVFWSDIKISTKSKAKRMKDTQFISELFIVLLEDKISALDQDHINKIYSNYDNLQQFQNDFDEDEYNNNKDEIIKYIEHMEEHNKAITNWATTLNNFYTLWALIALNQDKPKPEILADRYDTFMKQVENVKANISNLEQNKEVKHNNAHTYYLNSNISSTDIKQRIIRQIILEKALGIENARLSQHIVQ